MMALADAMTMFGCVGRAPAQLRAQARPQLDAKSGRNALRVAILAQLHGSSSSVAQMVDALGIERERLESALQFLLKQEHVKQSAQRLPSEGGKRFFYSIAPSGAALLRAARGDVVEVVHGAS